MMEGGNKVSLDLEAGLDVNTSDMLVPINQATWQHNWQKYQGKFLPNSVRFEKNGWAAGWNVYDFKYENLRINIDTDLWANNVKLNDTPVYMVSLYNAEYSADVIKSFIYTKDSRILYVSNGTAVFDADYDNIVHCAFYDIACNITFDKTLKELTVDSNEVRMTYELRHDDNTYSIILIKKEGSLDVNCDFKIASELSCDQFKGPVSYAEFASGTHSWCNGTFDQDLNNWTNVVYRFDGTDISVDGVTVPSTDVTIEGNTVTFSYDKQVTKQIGLQLTLHDYINEYSDLSIMGAAYDSSAVISFAANDLLTFNTVGLTTNYNDLDTSHEVIFDIQVPVWFTAIYRMDIDYSLGVLEPNNTYANSIMFSPNINSNTVYYAKNVFTGQTAIGTVAEFASATKAGVSVPYRYNSITLGNSITWTDKSHVYTDDIRDESIFYGELGNFPGFNRNAHASGTVGEMYWSARARTYFFTKLCQPGDNYFYNGYDCPYYFFDAEYNPSDWLAKNDVFDDNTCANIVNVDNIASYKLKGTSSSTNLLLSDNTEATDRRHANEIIYNAVKYEDPITAQRGLAVKDKGGSLSSISVASSTIQWQGNNFKVYREDSRYYKFNEIYNGVTYNENYLRVSPGTPQFVNGTIVYVPGWFGNFMCNIPDISNDASGGYAIGTYTEVTAHDWPDADYFPFRFVPCFNYAGSSDTNDYGVYETNVYAVVLTLQPKPGDPSNQIYIPYCIKTLSELQQLLFGTYHDIGENGNPLRLTFNERNRQRTVIKFSEPFFDFNRFSPDTEADVRLQWSRRWNSWFPGVQDPQQMASISMEEDFTYTNYNNIVIKEAKAMTGVEYVTELLSYTQAKATLEDDSNDAEAQVIVNTYESDERERAYIDFTQPGYVIHGTTNNIVTVSCFNDYAIIPWKGINANTPTFTYGTFKTDIYHNHLKVNSLYSTTIGNAGATMSFSVSLQHASNTTESFTVPFTSFKIQNGTLNIKRRSKNFAVTYTSYTSIGLASILVTDPDSGTVALSGGDCDLTISPNNSDAWLDSLVINNGSMTQGTFRAGISGDIIKPISRAIDEVDGLVISAALKGHACVGMRYNYITSAQKLRSYKIKDAAQFLLYEDPENDQYVPPLEIFNIEDSDLVSNKIYIDRDTVPYSSNWLKVNITDFNPFVHLFDMSGNVVPDKYGCFTLDFVSVTGSNFVTYYGQTDTDSNNMPKAFLQYYPPIGGNINGNMVEEVENIGGLKTQIVGLADNIRIPVAGEFIARDIDNINHIFYTKGLLALREATFDGITTYDSMVDYAIDIPIGFNGINLIFNAQNNHATIPNASFDLNDATVYLHNDELDFNYDDDTDESEDVIIRNINLDVMLHYIDVTGNFAQVITDNYELQSYIDNVYSIRYNNEITFNYSLKLNKLIDRDAFIELKYNNGIYNIQFIFGESQSLIALFNYLEDNELIVNYKEGEQYNIDISQFDGNDILNVEYTDIRNDNKSKLLGNINASEEFQLVKQQWNSTVDVENYWWVDKTHILELSNSSFIFKRNTFELDDWNGNRWENIYELPRLDIIGSDVCYYTVLNVFDEDTSSLFMLVRIIDNKLNVTFYDIKNKFTVAGVINLEVRNKSLGELLNNTTPSGTIAYLNTYSDITCKQVLSQAKWTNTIRDGKIILGCHMSNNFDQWAVIIDIDTFGIIQCIQGYGYVSIKGDLTGGQIPNKYFDVNSGFSGTVQPLNTLTDTEDINSEDPDAQFVVAEGHESEINTVIDRIVGTAEKQWYITKSITKVVSHLTYNNGTYTVQCLPITNNYDSVYESPSFMSEVLYDNKLISKALSNLVEVSSGTLESVWNTFTSLALNPSIYLYAPKFASIIYLQQTLGQYAYVHYNSTREVEKTENEDRSEEFVKDMNISEGKMKEPLLSDDITFDKQILKQSGITPYNKERQGLLFLFNVFLPSIKAVDSKLAVNESINLSTIDEVADVFTQSVSENLVSVMAQALHTDSPATGIDSMVVGVRSLDMFYSTSDNQRVFAGPGFVEHQFVADCVAQSVTNVNMTCYVQQLSFVIKVLSVWKLKMAYLATTFAHDLAKQIADYTAQTTIEALGSGGNLAGVIAGIAMVTVLEATKLAARGTMIAQEEIENLISKLADQMKAENIDSAIRQKTDTEGKHKYGEKNETFMWPCYGIPPAGLDYNDEFVVACAKKTEWSLNLMANRVIESSSATKVITDPGLSHNKIAHSTLDTHRRESIANTLKGKAPLYVASCFGKTNVVKLPKDMAKIEGVTGFLPSQAFKNQNISVSEPVFTPSLFQDYIVDNRWQLAQCVTYGLTQWITCKDTKLINCAPSNMIIMDDFCGISCPYTAIEVKRGLSKDYMRPWAVTPNVLAFNSTGYNTVLDGKMYHAFDGISYRITDWTGAPGMNKNNQNFLYCFQINDRFKRSNKFPANEVQGNFSSDPTVDVNTIDKVFTLVTNAAKQKGMEGGTIGEDKDVTRWALPIFTEQVNTMPAAVKTLTAMQLNVYDGITALTTNIMNNQTAYKAPKSVDFVIGKNTFRYTNDYICSVQTKEGVDIVTEIVPVLGMTYIGSTLTEAYFYSKATRCMYIFSGSTLTKMNMFERFRDIQSGAWDFINHEVVMPCLMSYSRLDAKVKDTDTETDNIIVPVLSKDRVSGEVPPPITTIFNDRSWYKVLSLPSGLVYQGPNRVIINRSIFVEYMQKSFKQNLGKWKRLDREAYDNKREYSDIYSSIVNTVSGVDGWTHNPFVLVTSPLGAAEDADCVFEWTITFCWPIEMDLIYDVNNYAVVNIMAETMTPGGKRQARPTHVYLTKELFTRDGNYGYYSFTYQSKNGTGNRERLYIWSDQYIAISSIDLGYKIVTQKRTEILTQQVDVKDLKEL